MRLATLTMALLATTAHAQQPNLVLRTGSLGVLGLPLEESKQPVYYVGLTASVDKKGEGKGTLELNSTAPAYDEFGFYATPNHVPPVKFDVTLKHVKTTTVKVFPRQRLGAPDPPGPGTDVEWKL